MLKDKDLQFITDGCYYVQRWIIFSSGGQRSDGLQSAEFIPFICAD